MILRIISMFFGKKKNSNWSYVLVKILTRPLKSLGSNNFGTKFLFWTIIYNFFFFVLILFVYLEHIIVLAKCNHVYCMQIHQISIHLLDMCGKIWSASSCFVYTWPAFLKGLLRTYNYNLQTKLWPRIYKNINKKKQYKHNDFVSKSPTQNSDKSFYSFVVRLKLHCISATNVNFMWAL